MSLNQSSLRFFLLFFFYLLCYEKEDIFATVEAGGGHVATAKAMSQSLESFYPGKYETVVLDFMKEVGCTNFDIFHKRLWRFALRYPLFARLVTSN